MIAVSAEIGHSARVDEELPMDFVRVSYTPEGDYLHGQLHVSARFDGFEGRADGWTNRQDVADFADRLKQYPLDERSPLTFSAGIGVGHDYIEFIGISAAPVGGKGQVILRIHLASEDWRDGRPVSFHNATIEFPTSYEYLRRFSDHMNMVLDDRLQQASLDVEILI